MGRGSIPCVEKLVYVKGIGAFCKKLSKNFCSEKIKSEVVYLAFLSAVMPPRCRPRISARANARGRFCGKDGRKSARQ